MAEEKVILELKNCPWCGHGETLTQRAWRETHSAAEKDAQVATSVIMKPLTSTQGAVTLTLPVVPSLITYEDACGKCGRPWITKALIKNVPGSAYAAALGMQMGIKPPKLGREIR